MSPIQTDTYRFKVGDRFTTPAGYDKTDPPWPEASGKIIKDPVKRKGTLMYEVKYDGERNNMYLGASVLDREAL
jgi:hypothetical protein